MWCLSSSLAVTVFSVASSSIPGINYSNASTPFPADSFPGLIGQVTGGNPGTTGIYYDDTWNHAVFPAGTKNCAGPAPGAEVAYTEADDINLGALDAGPTGKFAGLINFTGFPVRCRMFAHGSGLPRAGTIPCATNIANVESGCVWTYQAKSD